MGAAAIAKKTCPRCGNAFEADAVFCPRDGARLEAEELLPRSQRPDPYIGRVIAGDIEIRGVAGEGAMGRVYRAHQKGIERDVAVKILHQELSSNAPLVQRFHREAKIASKLQHPHVVDVYLAGQLSDGSLYIVMEYLDGMSLSAALQAAGGRMSVDRALSIALQMCDAVGEGHARGIVHRDLKPENVMLVRRVESSDWVKVLDFGIAKVSLGEQSMETAAGLIFGTARYISPEGAQGVKVGPPGDVYAIATIVYQLLCGRTPFDGEPLGLLVKHIHEQPPHLNSWPDAKDVPDGVARVVMENLVKDPARRAPNARALGNVLAAAAKEASVSISDVGVVARLSALPEPPVAYADRPSQLAVEPTMDDAAGVTAPAPREPTARIAPIAAAVEPSTRPPAPTPAEPPAKPRTVWMILVPLAFVMGIALAIVGMPWVAGHASADRLEHIERTRRALTDGHYVAPPGENVRELVAQGLVKWPNDSELRKMRSEAEHEMVTMAIAARASGDLVGARNLARDAYSLDATDNAARYTRAQAEDELEAISTGAGLKTGAPRLVFESPAVVKPGQRVDVTCRIIPGQAGPNAKISGIKMSVFPNGQTTGGTPVTLSQPEPTLVRATLTAGAVGSYDVAFEASVDGIVVRAMRDLDVAP